MTIPNLPMLDPFSPTFRSDVDAFFQGQVQATINAINPEIERINQIGAGSFTATSSTSLTVGTGTINLTIDTGKGFAPGQSVIVARTATPADFMAGQVVSYDAGTGAMVVDATTSGGTGTHSGWTVSVTSIVSALELDSIVVLTSGTSWTCPAGVRKARIRGVGGGGGGRIGSSGILGHSGGAGGYFEAVLDLTPGSTYSYSIGAGGAQSSDGGNTTFSANNGVLTANGGMTPGHIYDPGIGGSATGPSGAILINGASGLGGGFNVATAGNSVRGIGGSSALPRYGNGGAGGQTSANPGLAGCIILELYK